MDVPPVPTQRVLLLWPSDAPSSLCDIQAGWRLLRGREPPESRSGPVLYPDIAIAASHHGAGWTTWSTGKDAVEFKSGVK